ncbi:hypothetical protein ABEB36_008068 [Hypothenemus hampei]|uniref:Uncharacterized protein n=1 Tax=Hypothenemus hampei TaxID=57062 RepID=A0ABD1ENJ1_HYPHA
MFPRIFSLILLLFQFSKNVLALHNAMEKFQNSVEQQTFNDVLLAIEERLRNLDNVYSMQLSESVQSKLDQYGRKLEFLDMKLIRLESIIMLNLDRISENISSKNHKDDMARGQIYRKLDNIYEGFNQKIDFLERKFVGAFEKIQAKVESTLQRLERMEEDMVQRNFDTEAELSDTTIILENYTTTIAKNEILLKNITVVQMENASQMKYINYSINSLKNNMDSIHNATLKAFNASDYMQKTIDSLKTETKEDFNSYAVKVADVTMAIWKQNDGISENLETVQTVVNLTRTEIQNGIRALMLHIAKTTGKGDKTSLESLKKSVNLSLEKIISQQNLFLESCHRVQMDESQIESEISQMLGKLIDMLETKMTTVMKDLKGIEKTIKGHDSKTHRNLIQANANIISLFEKTTKINELAEKQLKDVKFSLDALFTFVQEVLPTRLDNGAMEDVSSTAVLLNQTRLELQMIILKLQGVLRGLNVTDPLFDNSHTLLNCTQNYGNLIDIRSAATTVCKGSEDNGKTIETNDDSVQKAIIDIFGTPPTTLNNEKSQINATMKMDSLSNISKVNHSETTTQGTTDFSETTTTDHFITTMNEN